MRKLAMLLVSSFVVVALAWGCASKPEVKAEPPAAAEVDAGPPPNGLPPAN